MPKGIYIVGESACLVRGSGAFQHIEVGFQELSKHFEMKLVKTCSNPTDVVETTNNHNKSSKTSFNFFKRQLSGLKILIKNHLNFFSYLKSIRECNPDFIYERAAYLNYNGLLAAKILRKPHFYEVNGILWLDNKKFHAGYFNSFARTIESWTYNKSDFIFFVGGLSKYFEVPARKYITVQNGIEASFVSHFVSEKKTPRADSIIEVVFIGHLMPHHRVEILCEASYLLKNTTRLRFHLVGKNLDQIASRFSPDVKIINHGVLSHEQISELLQHCHIGVVPYVKDYYSNVKAFMYGAGRLLVMLPRHGNFADVFSEEEVLSINNADAIHLASRLDEVVRDPKLISDKGQKIYQKVAARYTWQAIFEEKAHCIRDIVDKRHFGVLQSSQ